MQERLLGPVSWLDSLLGSDDDFAGRTIGVQVLDQDRAPLEHRPLVDVALVGDLVRVDRGRLGHDEGAHRVRRRARTPASSSPRALTAAAFRNTSAPTSLRSWPVITAS